MCIGVFIFCPCCANERFCDLPRDPHSPTQVGTEHAFAFFETHKLVQEEFVPRHLSDDSGLLLRLLDTWAWLIVAGELAVAYTLGGKEALFCCFTSGWLCQTITLWFNVANHPVLKQQQPKDSNGKPPKSASCTATDESAPLVPTLYIPFHILHILSNSFLCIVMEGEHDHHHSHATLAKRSAFDTAYWGFIRPLEALGLVWNVVVKEL
jgi:hypothetical protein